MNFLAFDIETARVVADSEELFAHRPLGITCYALAWRGADGIVSQAGRGQDDAGKTQPQMSRQECCLIVETLADFVRQGFTLLTWNGCGFDFNILAEESGMHEACCELARAHVDMMFHFFCLQGYVLGLETAATGMGLLGKLEGMDGSQAPLLWQQGRYDQVLAYVMQDAVMTLKLGEAVAARRHLRWRKRRGKANRVAIAKWLPVRDALKLPLPTHKWIHKPMPRDRFTAWMDQPASSQTR